MGQRPWFATLQLGFDTLSRTIQNCGGEADRPDPAEILNMGSEEFMQHDQDLAQDNCRKARENGKYLGPNAPISILIEAMS